jgi:hypothetical protein
MVQLRSLLSLLLLAASPIFANPDRDFDDGDDDCVDGKTARDLVQKLQYFYVNMDPVLAEKTLTEDFQLVSDSQLFSSPHTGDLVSGFFLTPKPSFLNSCINSFFC